MQINPIKQNVTEIKLNDYIVLVSYKTPVAYLDRRNGEVCRTSKKWSKTTTKHINQWLSDYGFFNAKEVSQEVLDSLL